jgi:hypothetical protein
MGIWWNSFAGLGNMRGASSEQFEKTRFVHLLLVSAIIRPSATRFNGIGGKAVLLQEKLKGLKQK